MGEAHQEEGVCVCVEEWRGEERLLEGSVCVCVCACLQRARVYVCWGGERDMH